MNKAFKSIIKILTIPIILLLLGIYFISWLYYPTYIEHYYNIINNNSETIILKIESEKQEKEIKILTTKEYNFNDTEKWWDTSIPWNIKNFYIYLNWEEIFNFRKKTISEFLLVNITDRKVLKEVKKIFPIYSKKVYIDWYYEIIVK